MRRTFLYSVAFPSERRVVASGQWPSSAGRVDTNFGFDQIQDAMAYEATLGHKAVLILKPG
jgi:hypothetical protein